MKIYWAGDSLSEQYNIILFPTTGLAQGMELYLKKEIKIYNHALGGRSTKSFIEEGRLDAIEKEISSEDFLFLMFGANDELVNDEIRYTTPYGTYKYYLKKFVDVAKKTGATPVLITPLERRCFKDAWNLGEGRLADYAAGMKQVAEEEQVALIDLYTKSRAKMEEAGAVETTKWFLHLAKGEYPSYPEGKVDDCHLNQNGARIFAGLIAEGLMELGGIYAELISEGVRKLIKPNYDTALEK